MIGWNTDTEGGVIIETRYRDVPWEETGCPSKLRPEFVDVWDKEVRGRPIRVRVPSHSNYVHSDRLCESSACDQPKYAVIGDDGQHYIGKTGIRVSVCPHIAEIGD